MTPEELKEARKHIIKMKRNATQRIATILSDLQSDTGLNVNNIVIEQREVYPADASPDYKIIYVRLETDFN